MTNEQNLFDDAIFTACTSLGQLMTTKEVNANTRTLLKISKFRNYLLALSKEQQSNNQ
jgi:hypothetical protein